MRPEAGHRSALAAARSFRLGMEAQGNEAFVAFVGWLTGELGARSDVAVEVEPLLAEIVAAQGRADFLRVADLVEFELLPRL